MFAPDRYILSILVMCTSIKRPGASFSGTVHPENAWFQTIILNTSLKKKTYTNLAFNIFVSYNLSGPVKIRSGQWIYIGHWPVG